jgi:hypothetical protein
MSHLRMLLLAAAAALSFAAFGPLLLGTGHAYADGLHPSPQAQMHMPGNTITINNSNTVIINVNRQVPINHVVHVVQPVQIVHVVQPVQVVQPVVVVPVSVVQPVAVAVPVVTTPTAVVVTTSYAWASYGPNWNAGWTLSQTAQLCQAYVQAVSVNSAAYNQYVQVVCVGTSSGTPY